MVSTEFAAIREVNIVLTVIQNILQISLIPTSHEVTVENLKHIPNLISEFLTSTVLILAATCTYIRSICKCMCSTFIDFSKDFKEELNFRQFDRVGGRTVIVETHLFSLTFWSKGNMTLISALKIDSIPAVRKCQLQVKL